MTPVRTGSRSPLNLALLIGLCCLTLATLTGCSESMVGQPDPEAVPEVSGSKLRHMDLLDRAAQSAGKSDGMVSLVVGLDDDSDEEEDDYDDHGDDDDDDSGEDDTKLTPQQVLHRYQVLHRFNVLHRFDFEEVFNGMAIDVPASELWDLLEAMEKDGDIEWVEPSIRVPFLRPVATAKANSFQLLSWGILRMGGMQSSAKSGDGKGSVEGVDIFILDTGVSSRDVNVVSRRDVNEGGDGVDRDGHGTHVAGTAAAIDDNRGAAGVAPGARIHSYKVTGPDGTADMASVILAIEEITRMKRRNPDRPIVVNIALGEDVGTKKYTSLDEAIKASSEAGVVYVVAAGNEGIDASTVTPAHTAEAITVGAHDPMYGYADFSNYGSSVDLVAPGVDILSLESDEGLTSMAVCLMSGTSMASAHVTGAAALYLSHNPDASPDEVRDALVKAAKNKVKRAPKGTTKKTVYVGNF